MYFKSKYIVGEILEGSLEIMAAIVFPETVSHLAVSKAFIPGTIRSAGFCHAEEEDVKVYGKSVGLDKSSSPGDEILVGRAMSHSKYVQY
jgi:hypothetical protein